MGNREQQLDEFRNYLKKTDVEITMVLQNLQWDRKFLLKNEDMCTCKHNSSHRILTTEKETHEEKCYLKCFGYLNQDLLLPDPVDKHSKSLVKFSQEDIKQIISNVSNSNVSLNKGYEDDKIEPLSLERLQSKYTVDERRAIYDTVVAHTPSQSDISELELPGAQQANRKPKTKLEVLAELRDMKRRRPKYRVATKSKNYSDVLREVIKNQMEWYAEITGGIANVAKPEIVNFKSEKEDWKQCDKRDTRNYEKNVEKSSSNNLEFKELNKYNNSFYNEKKYHRNSYNPPTCSKFHSSIHKDSKKYEPKRNKERYNDCDHYKDTKNERSKHRHESKHESHHRDRGYKGQNNYGQRRNREY